MTKVNKIIIGGAIILAIAVVALAIFNNNKNSSSTSSKIGLYDAFAQCLTDKGAVMYGAEWCSHCKAQKAAFGDSFRLIKYVECPDNTQSCIDKLEGFDDNKTMKQLSDATGCPLPQAN
jgi:hypothetical protein